MTEEELVAIVASSSQPTARRSSSRRRLGRAATQSANGKNRSCLDKRCPVAAGSPRERWISLQQGPRDGSDHERVVRAVVGHQVRCGAPHQSLETRPGEAGLEHGVARGGDHGKGPQPGPARRRAGNLRPPKAWFDPARAVRGRAPLSTRVGGAGLEHVSVLHSRNGCGHDRYPHPQWLRECSADHTRRKRGAYPQKRGGHTRSPCGGIF